jgi:hypothetical protein
MDDALPNAARKVGTPLTPLESALLARICAGSWRGSEEARAQLLHARWGGKDHHGDACFVIDIPAGTDLPLIPPHGGGPIATLAVIDEDVHLGLLELWVDEGRIRSLEYPTWGDTCCEKLPEVQQLADLTPQDGAEQSS